MLHFELSGRILGCAIAVHRALGSGYPEFMYQSALEIEFRAQKLRFARESPMTVLYRNQEIGRFRADFIVEDLIVVEIKAVPALVKGDYRQLLNYLYASTYELGQLVNFGAPRIQVDRKIFTNDRKVWMTRPPLESANEPQISGVRA